MLKVSASSASALMRERHIKRRTPMQRPLNLSRRLLVSALAATVLAGGATAPSDYWRAPIAVARAAATGPALSVDAAADRHPISDDIYGLNSYGVDPNFAKEIRVPVQRWGVESCIFCK